DFAVTLQSKILFLDGKWQTIASAAHEYEELAALAFDESEELIYFHDRKHQNGSIFALRRDASVGSAASLIVEQMVKRTGNDSVAALTYDAHNRNLFWTDIVQGKIYFASIDTLATEPPKVLVDLSAEGVRLSGIAVDICRRQLYWTNAKNKNASVERIALNGTGRQAIITHDIDDPRGIVIDQLTDRLFWIDDKVGLSFAVESSNLDGSDRQLVVKANNQMPIQLAVTADTIYWTEELDKAVWSYPKPNYAAVSSNTTTGVNETSAKPTPTKVASWSEDVHGIVARTGFYQHLQKDAHCANVVRKIKERLANNTNLKITRSPIDERVKRLEDEHCLNGGRFVSRNNFCICQTGFKGARCEIPECYNYCMHGTCEIDDGFPKCYCQTGFYGDRCEYYKCNGHCLNNGHCALDQESGSLSCKCLDMFVGTRCEHNLTEICARDCQLLVEKPDMLVPAHCQDICEAINNSNGTALAEYHAPDYSTKCSGEGRQSIWTGSVIIVLVVGVVIALALVAVIVHGLRLIYKPKRPHIKKTFVVRKQARHNSASDTPLTNRPLATEQCEITIENCCNMNICETPCFDPKLVEQTFSARDRKAACVKEDKKILIHSMDDDLL
ncbi:hypothetical protein KR222_009659, partial [Zaprionus bogoriensis]